MAMSKGRKSEEKWDKANPWFRHLNNARIRCRHASHKMFYRYGARGIKCFLTFDQIKELWYRDQADALSRPSLDRIDANRNYTFDNCRFIELEQNIGRRPRSGKAERKEFA